MTGQVVGRDARTAYLSAAVRPTGVSTLMPHHSQGAERRQGHRAGRTGSRWGLRALVVGVLAGAAWLLTGAAAHAADRDPAAGGFSLGSSLLGSVVHGDDHGVPVVDRVPTAAAQPLDSLPRRRSGSVPALPAQFVGTPDQRTAEVDDLVRELTAPLRLPGETVDTRPVPVPDAQEPEPPRAVSVPAPPVRLAAMRSTSSAAPEAEAPGAAADQSVVDLAGAGETLSLRVHLGIPNGVPASGPGAPEGGSAAFLPAGIADSLVAYHRLPIAAGVEARRHDAEAPTVSPD